MISIKNPILLVLLVILIGGSIWYLLSIKAKPPMASDLNVPSIGSILSSSSAPPLSRISGYINAPSNLTIASLRGKVVLVDFWTYSCINCIRTLPYLKAWDEKYRNDGLVIIGVHTPEFEFEKNYSNVKNAVDKFGIKYPVVLDSDYGTWSAYGNQYWPHKYLIDANGTIRYDHIGEGNYEETESQITRLLAERQSSFNPPSPVSASMPENISYGQVGTPEIYLGYGFARARLANPEGFVPNQEVNYSYLEGTVPYPNRVYLSGIWKNNADNMELVSDTGKVLLAYHAKNVNIVAGGNSNLTLVVDGQSPVSALGLDAKVVDSKVLVQTNSNRLYSLIYSSDYADRFLEFNVTGKGFRLYTFTFG
ncbi:thioredoxin family protein [Candidatus Micrarchaeota archaeon]|nr:thioredoxin family protein [Candidatus Micrarchaeota archaeon]